MKSKASTFLCLLILLIFALIMLSPIAAQDQPQSLEDGKLTIAWIPKALNNPVFELGRDGCLAAAKELTESGPYEVECVYRGSMASDMDEQARVMQEVVEQEVDAIGVSCNSAPGCIDPINAAVAAGIPVMTWDSDSPDSERFTYLGISNYLGGRAAADLLVRQMGQHGKVALLTGVPGATNLEERIQGFKDFIAKYPDIEIVTTVAGNDDVDLSVQVVEETMMAYPDLNGWFFVGLWPIFAGQGAMPLYEQAVADNGLVTVAFDTLPVELEWLQAGLLHGLVGQKYWGWGYDTVYMIYNKIVNGQEYESWTNSGMDIVTSANVAAMAEAWETSDFTQPLPPAFPPDGTFTIGWIPKALDNPVFELGSVGCMTAAAELSLANSIPVECRYLGSISSDMAEQAQVIEQAVSEKVDAIGISCNNDLGCVDPINAAVAAGIPVMTWDSDSPDSQRSTYLGISNYDGGQAAGELLIKAMGKTGKVAVLTGVLGATNLDQRVQGFNDYLAQYPDIEIVATVACNDDINLSVQVVEETMLAYPDLDGWFFAGLWPILAGQGAMPLFEEAALRSEDDMKVVAFDTLPDELEWLQAGLLDGLVGQKYWGWGYDTVYMAFNHAVYGIPYEDFTNSGMDIVTINNVEAMAEAWETQDFTQPLPPAFPEE